MIKFDSKNYLHFMKITSYRLPEKLLAEAIDKPKDFCFINGENRVHLPKAIAIEMAPIIAENDNPDHPVDSFKFPDGISKSVLLNFYKLKDGKIILISENNVMYYKPLSHATKNVGLEYAINYIESNFSPKFAIQYLVHQFDNKLSISLEVEYIAKHFDQCYQELIDQKIHPSIIKEFLSVKSLQNSQKRLLNDLLQLRTKVFSKLDKYLVISSPYSRKDVIEVNYDGCSCFQGLIAYLKSLLGKKLLEPPYFAIEVPEKSCNLDSLTDFSEEKSLIFSTYRISDTKIPNYIQYDFYDRKIIPNAITLSVPCIKYSPAHWALLGSNDLNSWTVLIEEDSSYPTNDSPLTKTVSFKTQKEFRFLRFVMLKNYVTNPKAYPSSLTHFNIKAIEFFGKLIIS